MTSTTTAPHGHLTLPTVAALADDLGSRAVAAAYDRIDGRDRATDGAGDAVARADRTGGAHDDALSAVADVLGAVDRLLAAVVVVLMRMDHRRVVAVQGLTPESWLRSIARRTGADAAMLMMAADRLSDMPATLRAFCGGVLTWGTVRGIVLSVRSLSGEQRRWLDAELTRDRTRLRRLAGDDVVAMADRLSQMARPDLHEARAKRAAGREHLAFQPAMDGTGTAHVAMDAETFATVQAAIDSVTHDPSGRRVASNVEALRTLARQRLTDVARAAAEQDDEDATDAFVSQPSSAPAPSGGAGSPGVRTEIVVVTDIALLADPDADTGVSADGAAADGIAAADPARATARLLWRQDRPPVSLTRHAVRRLACDATLRPVLTDGVEILGTADPYARVSAPLRTALIARDGGCRFAACQRPANVCDAHHVVHRADGGPTVLDNLALLCRAHHRAVHEGGWRATLEADGAMTFSRRGVTLHSLPAGQRVPAPRARAPRGRRSRHRSRLDSVDTARRDLCGDAAADAAADAATTSEPLPF